MTGSGKSVFFIGIYLYLCGLTLMIAPNFLLGLFQLPETKEVWIRVVGVLTVCLGFYYHRSGVENNTAFIKLTVPGRFFAFLCYSVFVFTKLAAPGFILFGVIDLVGATWTFVALRKEK